MDLGLAGRTALVTGSYRGTGAGIASVLAAEGAHVLVHGFEEGQPGGTVDAITAAGGSAEPVVADLFSDDGVSELASVTSSVDVLVNNYGKPLGSSWSSSDLWDAEWNHNVMSAVRVTQACTPAMTGRGWGRVVFVGTVGTRRPGPTNAAYYASKAGLHALVRSLAKEVGGSGVTANLVSPGMIATGEIREMLTRRAVGAGVADDWESVQQWGIANSMPNLTGRIPSPDDIGRVVAFVASEPAWHINGADIAVDGATLDAGA